MKNLCSIIVILLSWSFLVFIYSCKDECKCKTSTSADFKIYEPLEDNYKFNEINNEDTAGIGITFFEAQDSSTDIISYEWRIGSDTRVFSKRSLSLQFQNKLNNLSVQLIVKNQ